MKRQDHPIWRILNMVVVFAGTSLILWLNATKFDHTEILAILGVCLVQGGWESVKHFVAIPRSENVKP